MATSVNRQFVLASRPTGQPSTDNFRLVEAPILIRPGQMVTVLMTQGGFSAKAVLKATEQGALGQTVRVRNETTGTQLDVVVTGEQTAKMVAAPSTAGEIVIR